MNQVHKAFKNHQKEEFKTQRNNLKEGECIILMDFKENLRLGGSAREVGKVFFHKSQVLLLGSVIYFRQNNRIVTKYVNFVSNVLNHDALFVKDCINIILTQKLDSSFKHVKFWFDCGTHFRCGELVYHCLIDVPEKFNVDTELHFSAPGHGKSDCGTHFSVLSRLFKNAEKNRIDICYS